MAALDTGASYTLVPWDVAEQLGYEPALSLRRVRVATASGVETAPLLTLEAVEVAGYRIPGVDVLCHDLPPETQVSCLLGLNFLRHFDIDLHLKSGRLELRDP
ncbi:MAG: retroviral-like aspartic protease family protein [Chloroflexi bacterium]|nr:retroviral-like aspartic protease family protein [Chloroflexota bacterium]